MPIRSNARVRRAITTTAVAALAGLAAVACGNGSSSGASGMDHGSMPASTSEGQHGMPGMGDMASGDGLAATASGFRFVPAAASLPAGQAASFRFQIQATDGKPVTAFEPDQTKLMHFYLIRSDLTGFQHIHPELATDGTWTAPAAAPQPGTYRAYTSFVTKDAAGKAIPLVLSEQITVAGTAATQPVPPALSSAQVDGYTLTLSGGQIRAGSAGGLTVSVSKDGQPVTDLEPYLDTYAHLTAFHEGDLAFAHLHPHGAASGDHGGPDLSFAAALPRSGNWRLFVQFQAAGVLHTAAVTVPVG